jgi:prepilin-type processing-associated H-X9-DG protein/prepilin-type N-terminal cleavage/methylation domain-containing protein
MLTSLQKRGGFTLIELLIVVATIAILVGILLPAMSRARQIGRATACLSNLHSLGQAVAMYADGHDGRLPSVGLAHGGSVDESSAWINVMAAEYGDVRVTRCPSDESPHWTRPLADTGQRRRLSYASNYYTEGTIEGKEEYCVATRIERPSTTIFWVELAEDGDFAVADHVHPETWFINPLLLAEREIQLRRHMDRANYAFVDGHAEPQRFDETYDINFGASAFPKIAWNHNKYDPALGW